MASTYSLAIDVQSRQPSQPAQDEPRSSGSAIELASDSIPFSAGNPRVEYLQGMVHLFRGVSSAATWADHVKAEPVRRIDVASGDDAMACCDF